LSIIKNPGFLKKETIESRAESILEQMRDTPKYFPKFPLDPTRVAEFLDLDVAWVPIEQD
jgi:hypothetical protein